MSAFGFRESAGGSGSGSSSGTAWMDVFTPERNQPPATSGFATLTTRNNISLLACDDAADESIAGVSVVPDGVTLTSGLTVRIKWVALSATTGNVVWVVSIMALNATTDIDSDSFDTSATATTATLGTSGFTQTTSITITTIDSLVAGDAYRIKVTRNADDAADTMAGDAQIVVVTVQAAA